MRAYFDRAARSLAIGLTDDTKHERTNEVATNVIVGVRDGAAVMVEVIRQDLVGLDGLDIAADEYGLDREALHAAADAALAAPDRDIEIRVLARAS